MTRTSGTARAASPQRRGEGKAATGTECGGDAAQLRLLVIVDGTEASKRAVRYTGQFAAGCSNVEIHLTHIASALPPALLESGGGEMPEREEQIEGNLRVEQRRFVVRGDRTAERIFRLARAALRRAGVAARRIHTCVSSPLDVRTVVDEVLLLARDERCRTIVVGHRAHTWFRGLGGGHLAEQLVRKAKGDAVWVID
jgi:nucleotide-binding universal stress UspA family protein